MEVETSLAMSNTFVIVWNTQGVEERTRCFGKTKRTLGGERSDLKTSNSFKSKRRGTPFLAFTTSSLGNHVFQL
jgi:hypothetical protein